MKILPILSIIIVMLIISIIINVDKELDKTEIRKMEIAYF